MVKTTTIDKKINEKILAFHGLLKKSGIDVEKIILYGSHARGRAENYSDIDLCVVSSVFGKNSERYFQKIWQLAGTLDSSLEPIPFTEVELANKYSTLANEINKYGIRVV